jgi:hypothetical protein
VHATGLDQVDGSREIVGVETLEVFVDALIRDVVERISRPAPDVIEASTAKAASPVPDEDRLVGFGRVVAEFLARGRAVLSSAVFGAAIAVPIRTFRGAAAHDGSVTSSREASALPMAAYQIAM